MYIPDCLEIKDSPIHGKGVFATKDIKANTKLVEFTGKEMTYQEIKERYGNDWRFIYRRMPWQTQIVAKDDKNLICFVNDGIHLQKFPKKNCILKNRFLISIENINAGDELLLDYGKKYWKN